MLTQFISSLFGSKHNRQLKKILPFVEQINQKFEEFDTRLSDEDFPRTTEDFKRRLKEGEEIDDLLVEAFALVKAACKRCLGRKWEAVSQPVVWDMVPYDVQLIGAVTLHQGKIAEMATGEGKTLVAIMPLYLNCLAGKGAHLITVNDYLAQRDAEWMGGVYELLGVSVGKILGNMAPDERRKNYGCDITYGTNNEFGFDYLRDNMAIRPEDVVQRAHHYAIVDEVDSVLIDEARTPLIIAGPVGGSNVQLYNELKSSVEHLVRTQRNRVTELVNAAEKIIKNDDSDNEYELGRIFLKAHRALPKHKRLSKALSESGMKTLMQQVEKDYMRDKKLHELDEELLYVIEERHHSIVLTDEGRELLAKWEGTDSDMFILPDIAEESHEIEAREDISEEEKLKLKDEVQNTFAVRSEKIHNISQLLRAYSLYEKDVEYVVQDGRVMIVDEFTGRLMPGRRFSDGLHQAIEAKEGVKVEGETQTVATITLQNYFRLYNKLAGMTGTAETEEGEFWDIYKLEVSVIPTNEPIRRIDHDDIIYKTKREKFSAIIEEIKALNAERLPVLVGTVSVEVSETLSRMLRRHNIQHNVLNAKHHKSEAEIVKNAGQPGAVTIATNMAGRGTDIKLGQGVIRWKGDKGDKTKAEGGLQIIGTERHESRRIDRQLRGRSGRQGDPGASVFFLSLEDDLMRLFGSERIAGIMDRIGAEEGNEITHPLITRSIEKAQKRVEAYNFGIRKHLLEYDDVMNQQREVVYQRRRSILFDDDIRKVIKNICYDFIYMLLDTYTDPHSTPDLWELEEFGLKLRRVLQIELPAKENWELVDEPEWYKKEFEPESSEPEESEADEEFTEWGGLDRISRWHRYLLHEAISLFERKIELYSEDRYLPFVRHVTLRVIDEKWKNHLYDMDRLKEGVGLRAYAQKDPLIEYKREGFNMFSAMLDSTNEESLRIVYNPVVQRAQPEKTAKSQRLSYIHKEAAGAKEANIDAQPQDESAGPGKRKAQPVKVEKTVGRNDPCPCGSGKKYKKCCGRRDSA